MQLTLNIFRERTLTRHVLFSGRHWLDGEQHIWTTSKRKRGDRISPQNATVYPSQKSGDDKSLAKSREKWLKYRMVSIHGFRICSTYL